MGMLGTFTAFKTHLVFFLLLLLALILYIGRCSLLLVMRSMYCRVVAVAKVLFLFFLLCKNLQELQELFAATLRID